MNTEDDLCISGVCSNSETRELLHEKVPNPKRTAKEPAHEAPESLKQNRGAAGGKRRGGEIPARQTALCRISLFGRLLGSGSSELLNEPSGAQALPHRRSPFIHPVE